MDDLNNLVLELAQARAEAAEAHARLVALMASTAIIEAQADEHFAKERVADLEDAVRQAALEEYARSGNKHPHPVVSVQMYSQSYYDFNLHSVVQDGVAPRAIIAKDLTFYLPAQKVRP